MSKVFYNKRYAEKIGFQSFLLFVSNNHFDVVANKAITSHEKTLTKLNLKSKNIADDSFWKILFIEEELKAIAEMKIIYAYKHFETCLKFMLKASYKVEGEKYHRWEIIKDFLSTKSIKLSEIEFAREIDELREVNNAIKHSNILESRITPKEFKEKELINYRDILQFYDRVNDCILKFFQSLRTQIENDLYEFSNERINEMTNKIEGTMEPEKAIELANKIISRYK